MAVSWDCYIIAWDSKTYHQKQGQEQCRGSTYGTSTKRRQAYDQTILEGFKEIENRTTGRMLLVFSSFETWGLWQGWLPQMRQNRKERSVEDQDILVHYQRRQSVTPNKRSQGLQLSFCTPSLMMRRDEHIEKESPALMKNGLCDWLVMSALVTVQVACGTYTTHLLSVSW